MYAASHPSGVLRDLTHSNAISSLKFGGKHANRRISFSKRFFMGDSDRRTPG
jgi:hypothetical protein